MSSRSRVAAFAITLVASIAAVPAGSALAAATPSTTPVTSVNLADYGLVARYELPNGIDNLGGDPACANSSDTLAQEASAVAFDPTGGPSGTGSLFVLGDGGACVVQTTLNGTYVDSMTLATGNSPAGNAFYDTEGITYVGQNGGKPQLVMTEERYRNIDEFDYTPNTTLQLTDATAVKLGTTIGNIGLEGVSSDPATSNGAGCPTQTVGSTTGNFCQGFIVVKEKQPEDIFQTNVDWGAAGSRGTQSTDIPTGTATNGGATENEGSGSAPTPLFPPALAKVNDFSDIFALSNIPSLNAAATGSDAITGSDTSSYDGDILIDSQESGAIEELNRSGTILSRLDLFPNPASGLDVVDETHEGVTMDEDGNLYVVSEDGAGQDKPELEVYAPEPASDDASPTAVALASSSGTLPSTTTTSNGPVKLSGLSITDPDGIGTDTYTVSATDANGTDVSNLFTADHTGLYVASGASLANVASPVTIHVSVSDANSTDPSSVVTSGAYALTVESAAPVTGAESKIIISEVDPSGSGAGNNSYGEDWFELTNTGTQPVSLTGWSADDSHEVAGKYLLNGVSTIAAGESVVFVQADTDSGATTTPAQTVTAFRSDWGLTAGQQVGYYSDADGLSQSGDEVNVYDAGENRVAGVSFGASENKVSFDNSAGINGPIITNSDSGDGAITASTGEVGSPDTAQIAPTVAVTEVDPSGSGAAYAFDWFELTNYGTQPVDMTGWTMDDSSAAHATAVTMTTGTGSGLEMLAPGQSIVFAEDPADSSVSSGSESTATLNSDLSGLETTFENAWFTGGTPPANFAFGDYGGKGVGLSGSGDGVTIFDANGNTVDEVQFDGTSVFENPGLAGVGPVASESAAPALTTAAAAGIAGAHASTLTPSEVGSPGVYVPTAAITEIDPAGSSTNTYKADWFELTNTSPIAIDLSGWTMDDSSDALGDSVPTSLGGAASILPAGQSIVFAEDTTSPSTLAATLPTLETGFENAWFPGGIAPSNFLFGDYGGSGVGLSSSGDAVNLFDATGTPVTGVTFGAAPAGGATFDNASGAATASLASVRGTNGARPSQDGTEIGSPGTTEPDTTAPTLTTSGNQGTYAETDTVDITCSATDDTFGSGVKTPCTGIDAPASSFGDGTHTETLSATDYAGNTATTQVTFTVEAPATITTTTTPTPTPPAPAPTTPTPPTTPTTPTAPTTPTKPTTPGGSGSKAAPAPKVGSLASKLSEAKIEKGVATTITRVKPKSAVTLTITSGKTKLGTFKSKAGKNGKATVSFHLTKQAAAKYRGKTVTVRLTVTDAKGHRHTITRKLKIS